MSRCRTGQFSVITLLGRHTEQIWGYFYYGFMCRYIKSRLLMIQNIGFHKHKTFNRCLMKADWCVFDPVWWIEVTDVCGSWFPRHCNDDDRLIWYCRPNNHATDVWDNWLLRHCEENERIIQSVCPLVDAKDESDILFIIHCNGADRYIWYCSPINDATDACDI